MEAQSELVGELAPGELLVWSGKPRQGVVFRSGDLFFAPFSLLWGGFAIFWEVGVIRSGAPFFFALFGVPFVLIGLYLIAGRFFADARMRENTYYGLTNERIIILSGLFRRSVQSLSLRSMGDMTLETKPDGSGSILFGSSFPMARFYRGTPWPGMSAQMGPQFDLIPDARRVYETILAEQRKLVSPS